MLLEFWLWLPLALELDEAGAEELLAGAFELDEDCFLPLMLFWWEALRVGLCPEFGAAGDGMHGL